MRDALDALVGVGLLRASPEGGDPYRPVAPKGGLGALLACAEVELHRRQQGIAAVAVE